MPNEIKTQKLIVCDLIKNKISNKMSLHLDPRFSVVGPHVAVYMLKSPFPQVRHKTFVQLLHNQLARSHTLLLVSKAFIINGCML